jgi:glycosyltransferase involved in cell wall biosynthesis
MNNHEPMRVVTSCRGRFWIFDQARELARHNVLHQLITDYPKAWPERFGVPPDKVRALVLSGFINHGMGRVRGYLPWNYQIGIDRWVHDRFSRQLAGLIPKDTQFFIGLSSFCLDALEVCRANGIPCAVDHGSLHQKEEARLVMEEARRWGLAILPSESADWIISKEDDEFHCADNVFVLSSVARDSMMHCGIPSEKIFVNPCGADLAQFYFGEKRDTVFRVIQVGGVTLRKGVLTLLDAFARAKLSNAELWFVGGGFETSGIQPSINAMCSPGVTFCRPVPQAKLRDYYNQSSVFVLASVADGFGMVVAQAMACGLPVIVTENVGAKDLIVDGVNGFIVPVGAPDVIADRLRQLHSDPELCQKMGLAAKLTIEKGYTWHDYGDRLVSFLHSQETS